MNLPVACVLIAGMLPLVSTAIAKWGFQGFDNHNPREWLSRQTGFRARANAAQVTPPKAIDKEAANAKLA